MNEERDTDARLWHPWLRINRVLRVMLQKRWSARRSIRRGWSIHRRARRHRMEAHAVARDAASGVGGLEESGDDMMNGPLQSLGVALVAVTVAQTAPVSVGELLSDPDRFRGQQ